MSNLIGQQVTPENAERVRRELQNRNANERGKGIDGLTAASEGKSTDDLLQPINTSAELPKKNIVEVQKAQDRTQSEQVQQNSSIDNDTLSLREENSRLREALAKTRSGELSPEQLAFLSAAESMGADNAGLVPVVPTITKRVRIGDKQITTPTGNVITTPNYIELEEGTMTWVGKNTFDVLKTSGVIQGYASISRKQSSFGNRPKLGSI